MPATESVEIARRAEAIYTSRLKDQLEAAHRDEFVAIEPDSGDYFLGQTLSEVIGLARKAHPDRFAHALRVGRKTAVHFGASLQ